MRAPKLNSTTLQPGEEATSIHEPEQSHFQQCVRRGQGDHESICLLSQDLLRLIHLFAPAAYKAGFKEATTH